MFKTGPWTDMYLKDLFRRAVALNHNPFMAFADDPKPAYMDQVVSLFRKKLVNV